MGGNSMGDAVRRILRKVESDRLWSNYNLNVRMEKHPFAASPVYKLVRRKYIFRVTTSQEIGRGFSCGIPYIVAVLENYTVFY